MPHSLTLNVPLSKRETITDILGDDVIPSATQMYLARQLGTLIGLLPAILMFILDYRGLQSCLTEAQRNMEPGGYQL